jgi:hypothetical protein
MSLLKLTDDELTAVFTAARARQRRDRDKFLQELARAGKTGPPLTMSGRPTIIEGGPLYGQHRFGDARAWVGWKISFRSFLRQSAVSS